MNRSPIGPRLQGALAVLVAAGVLAAGYSAIPARAASGESSTLVADAEAKALAKLDDDWSKAAATRDADKVAAFYAEDATAYPPNEPVCVGREAARKVWAAYFAEPTFTISWKTDHAEVASSGEIGFTAGTYQDSFKGPDGKMVHEKGKYLCVWKKGKDGAWKATNDMWNSDASTFH